MTISDRATRLTARVAPYRDAITKARKAGLTWRDIGQALGVQSPDRLRWAVAHCGRYEAEQIPLPEPTQTQPKESKEQPMAQVAPQATGKKLFDSIPKINGGKS